MTITKHNHFVFCYSEIKLWLLFILAFYVPYLGDHIATSCISMINTHFLILFTYKCFNHFLTFQDKLSFPEMQSILKQMEEVTKCSNCLRVLTPPLRCCFNGHCICKKCNNCECLICEESLVCTDSEIIIKKVLSILPKECDYFTEGCNRMLLPDTLKDHKKVCIFRTVYCHLKDCK